MRLSSNGDFHLRREYSEAIETLGGVPFHLPLIPKKEFVEAALGGLDGILLPGSDSDVDPLRFGEEPHRRLGKVQPLRDETDLLAIAAAERLKMPILGICYGMQALSVARGGSLIQDIESQIPNSLQHQQGEPRDRRSHTVILAEKSLLRILSGQSRVIVNSHHHQSVSVAGENLKVTARSTDGVIEAVEDERKDRFALGVQWHPELDWENDSFSQNIFSAFLKAAVLFRKSIKESS